MGRSFWRCPACGRSRYEIMRWTTRYLHKNDPKRETVEYEGWMAGLHEHHDHGAAGILGRVGERFPPTVLCDQCNAADGHAKKKLKLPDDFSFSPQEVGEFVSSTPHGRHQIDLSRAFAIYEKLR